MSIFVYFKFIIIFIFQTIIECLIITKTFYVTDTEAINLEVTGNSHNATSNTIGNKIMEDGEADQTDAAQKEKEEKSHSSRKEKSVLQSKLTRLAIQIGYGGMRLIGCIRRVNTYQKIQAERQTMQTWTQLFKASLA